MTTFDSLVADFEALAKKALDAKGGDLRAIRRQQAQVERQVSALAETGMHSYNAEYTDCRDIGHQWDERYSAWEGNQMDRMTHCERCGTERYESFNRLGALLNRRYVYAEGYLLTDDELREAGASKKRFWRSVNVQRTITLP